MTPPARVARSAPTALAMAVTAAAGTGACSLSLVSGERPVLTVGAIAGMAVLAAVLTGWRWLGSAATLLATTTVLLAAVSGHRLAPGHLVLASALLLVLVAGLDRVESPARASDRQVLARASLWRRLAAPMAAVGAAAGVAVTATQPVVPSAGLVLLGLAAGLGALLVAVRTP